MHLIMPLYLELKRIRFVKPVYGRFHGNVASLKRCMVQEAQAVMTACCKSAAMTAVGEGEDISEPGLLSFHSVGILTVEEFLQAKDLCQKCCAKVSSFSRLSMAKAFS